MPATSTTTERTAAATVTAATTFSACAWSTQRLGLLLGIGCYAPVVGGLLSAACVSAGAVAAGRASRLAADYVVEDGRSANRRRRGRGGYTLGTAWSTVDEDEAIRDVAVGGAAFALLSRGNVGRILPSDVSRVGANARRSIPAKGSDYASEGQKRALQTWLKRDGCHHCGSTRGKVIGDHMPPNKKAFGSAARAAANRGASTTRRVFNFIRGVPLQRFYPQCEACSALQSVAVRTGATRLVAHSVGVRYAFFAGAAVGVSALHYDDIRRHCVGASDRLRRFMHRP